MEMWFITVLTLCITFCLTTLISLFFPTKSKRNLPPGPPTFPIFGSFLLIRKRLSDFELLLRDVKLKYGPLITLWIAFRPAIFVASHSLAHRALIQKGAIFADRPPASAASKLLTTNHHTINSAPYGPTWRLLRRNLTSEIFHPSRIKSYSHARRWVLAILFRRLYQSGSIASSPVTVMGHFQYAMFCLLVLMCFGDKLEENQIKQIETVHRQLLLSLGRFNVLSFWPMVGKIVFRKRWKDLIQLLQNREAVVQPLISNRIRSIKERQHRQQTYKLDDADKEADVVAYVDTLVDLELPDEKRKLNDGEMVGLCSEFLNAGTDTTSTALQWIMANLVKYPQIQAKLYEEITSVVGSPPAPPKGEEEMAVFVKEDDLQRMPYLKAVVMEALRRHPPGHFVLPHAVTEDVELDGYIVPKNATINFMVADMNWDPKVWEDPMEFKPERFLQHSTGDDHQVDGAKIAGEVFDITGSKEIKMMPFGAGRRICPGAGLALLHLEFFVANLVWYFQWRADDGDDVDLSEKQEFTIVMKKPLKPFISARSE